MKQTINFNQFARDMREARPTNFSYSGLRALFEMLEQYEEDTDTELDFDPIGLCCEFSELSEEEIRDQYNVDESEEIEEFLSENTIYAAIDEGNFIIQDF